MAWWCWQTQAQNCRMADVFRLTARANGSNLMFRLPQVGHGTGLRHLRGRVSLDTVFVVFPFVVIAMPPSGGCGIGCSR